MTVKTANPNQGWRIAPSPGAELRRTAAGRFAIDLEITFNGEHVTTIEHIYTGDDIERLHRQMRALLAQGLPVPAHEDRRRQKAEMGGGF